MIDQNNIKLIKLNREKVVNDNTDGQQEEIKPGDMKQELVQKILEQQRIIGDQQNEIDKLKNRTIKIVKK